MINQWNTEEKYEGNNWVLEAFKFLNQAVVIEVDEGDDEEHGSVLAKNSQLISEARKLLWEAAEKTIEVEGKDEELNQIVYNLANDAIEWLGVGNGNGPNQNLVDFLCLGGDANKLLYAEKL